MQPEELKDVPAVPWEDPGRGWLSRFFGTLRASLHPIATAGSFASSDRLGAAVGFAALTWLPLAMAQGVIPFTHHLQFGGGFSVSITPSSESITTDVVRAIGLGLIMACATWACLTLSFVSLCRAYGGSVGLGPGPGRAAFRAALYSSWLFTFVNAPVVEEGQQGIGGLGFHLVAWIIPSSAELVQFLAAQLAYVGPLVLVFMRLRHAAVASCRVGPLASFAVVLIPFVLMTLVERQLIDALHDWIPATPPSESSAP